MNPLDSIMLAIEQINRTRDTNGITKLPTYIEIGASVARDPEVKRFVKFDKVNRQQGEFMGISIRVVPDVKAVFSAREKPTKVKG